MKLLLCTKCSDIFPLRVEDGYRYCECGLCYGKYLGDSLNAVIYGPTEFNPQVIGFANNSLISELRNQILHGNLKKKHGSGVYKGETKGRPFEAFIIPEGAKTVKRYVVPVEEKNDEHPISD